jgi:hypothetical protein
MASLMGIRLLVDIIVAHHQKQKLTPFDCGPWKSTCSRAAAALFFILVVVVALALPADAQTAGTDASVVAGLVSTANLVRWTGTLPTVAGRTIDVSFALYQESAGGLALWSETQPVKVGTDGRYTVLLGASSAEGLPPALFQTGEARWIEARPIIAQQIASSSGDAIADESYVTPPSRSLLTAVPYAFKSADADTLAGRVAGDYVTREDLQSAVANQVQALQANQVQAVQASQAQAAQIVGLPLPIGGASNASGIGSPGFLPIWSTYSTLGSSLIAQYGANIGIGTVSPATLLDVNGASTLRGTVSLLATAATLAVGINSPSLQLGANTYSSTSNAAVPQNFFWQAISSGNNTASPTANLTLLFGSDTTAPSPTGLSISPNGQIAFALGQTFPGVGAGTITGITTGPGLTGGGSNGNVSLALSGPVSTANGGTGAADPADALANLGGISSTQTTLQTLAGPLSGTSIGIGTVSPATPLDVNGASTLRGTVSLLATAATLAVGINSPQLQLGASTYSSTSNVAVPQNFVWQAQSAGNNTASPTANLTLLFGSDITAPLPTGLSISPNGQITFAPGQVFPGTSLASGSGTGGSGTITGVVAGTGLTGGGSNGNVTLALTVPVSIDNGGTGSTTVTGALSNLGGAALFGATFTGPVSAPSLTTGNNSSVIVVDGSVYPRTGAGIQSAIAAASALPGLASNQAPTVFLACGYYPTTSTILLTTNINLTGAGTCAVLDTTGGSAPFDVLTIAPTNSFNLAGITIQNLTITAASTYGRYAINFDATNGQIVTVTLRNNVLVGGNSNPAVYANANGVLGISTIRDNFIVGGFTCRGCGDTLDVSHNVMMGANGLDISSVSGATSLTIDHNNITSTGVLIHLGGYVQSVHVLNNELETESSSVVGSNGAMIDIDGANLHGISSATVAGNSCQIVNGSNLNCIRVNYANNTNIYDNNFGRGVSPSTDIVVTANAFNTTIGTNKWTALPYSSMLSDAGTGTCVLAMFNGTVWKKCPLSTPLPQAEGGTGATTAPTSFPGFGTMSGVAAQGGVIAAGGPTGSASVVPVITYNAAGQLTAVTTATITPAAIGAAATNASTTGTSGGVAATAGTANSVVLANATSGTITIQATTGALGSVTLTAPATTGTLALTSQIPAATSKRLVFPPSTLALRLATMGTWKRRRCAYGER